MNYTGIGEAIDLIESRDKHPIMDALKMAVGKLKQEREIMVQLQSRLTTTEKERDWFKRKMQETADRFSTATATIERLEKEI